MSAASGASAAEAAALHEGHVRAGWWRDHEGVWWPEAVTIGRRRTPEDVIAAAFRAAPGDDRPGDGTPGEVARRVTDALMAAGYEVVDVGCPRCQRPWASHPHTSGGEWSAQPTDCPATDASSDEATS